MNQYVEGALIDTMKLIGGMIALYFIIWASGHKIVKKDCLNSNIDEVKNGRE